MTSTPRTRKSRHISLVTYANEKQIKKILKLKAEQVRGYAYIHHDQDGGEPHFHLVVSLYESRTSQSVAQWFKGLTDKDKQPINTMGQPVGDDEALEEYLTHSDPVSRNAGKHWYPREKIIDVGYFIHRERHNSRDSSYEIINAIITNTPVRELVRRYGRDYLYHYNAYSEVAEAIRYEEGWREAKIASLQHSTTLTPTQWDTEKEFTP